MKLSKAVKLISCILICELAGILGTIFTSPSIPTWYRTLQRPSLSPPNWVFGPVWTILFLLMGIAAYLVWQKGLAKKQVQTALVLFIIQLVLNTYWSIIFFGLHNLRGALIEIVFLWFAILLTVVSFYKISKTAAYLLIPYILWVSFAIYLTYSIWLLN
jgi:tryptophan-rich sensory protein